MTTFNRRTNTKGTLLNKKQIENDALTLIQNVADLPEDADVSLIQNVEAYQIVQDKAAELPASVTAPTNPAEEPVAD